MNRETVARIPKLCQNDRAGMGAIPKPCRAPVRNTKLQEIIEIMIAQNATLVATVAATRRNDKHFFIFFTSSQKAKLKAKGRLPP